MEKATEKHVCTYQLCDDFLQHQTVVSAPTASSSQEKKAKKKKKQPASKKGYINIDTITQAKQMVMGMS